MYESVQDKAAENSIIHVERIDVESEFEFCEALHMIGQEIPNKGIPFIQLDAHGALEQGLQFKNGDTLSWADLYTLMGKLNERTRNRMGVISNVCFSMATIANLDLLKPSPFSYLGAPHKRVSNGYLETHISRFYELLFNRADLSQLTDSLGSEFRHFYPESVAFHLLCEDIRKQRGRRGANEREFMLTQLMDELAKQGSSIELREARKLVKSAAGVMNDGLLENLLSTFLCGRETYFTASDINSCNERPAWLDLIDNHAEAAT